MRDERFRELLVRHVISELPPGERAELEDELERRGEEGRRELR